MCSIVAEDTSTTVLSVHAPTSILVTLCVEFKAHS